MQLNVAFCFFLWLLHNFKVQHESVSALTLRSISTIQAMHRCENVFGTCLLSAIHANITGMSNALNKNSKHYNMKCCLTPSSNHSWSHFSAATNIFSWTCKGTFGKWKMIGGNFGNKQHLRDKWIKTDETWYGPSDFNQSPAHLPFT